MASVSPTGMRGFDPRPREGGDLLMHAPFQPDLRFRSTPPRGGRLLMHAPFQPDLRFRSTPPRGGRHGHHVVARYLCRFDPRPREGGDQKRGIFCAIPLVSIHAPARGATPATNGRSLSGGFRSTPPRGGRPLFAC